MPEQMPPILRYFKFGHLPDHLKAVSAPFADLANQLVETLPPGPELSVALRKLLESKDAAVRAALDLPQES
ncbi:hypothetical protein [Streptomyces sp. STCH 565 A]|uniref:hypothetical protein n=1 Tax=Streptomyces sp. STCH 565 A TaxID=2950532 RepID=UPI00207642C6|nr:hypothetical protein [Streptomyces sp. STCH 565 A]MCM8554000.1 hypothetical protein [Streptomyces sp. STCH 565 A]